MFVVSFAHGAAGAARAGHRPPAAGCLRFPGRPVATAEPAGAVGRGGRGHRRTRCGADAADRIGLGLKDFEPAEAAQLVRLSDGAATFRHPLIRSAVYRRAAVTERITAHRALADVLPVSEFADRRAWHLAAAAVGFDDAAADAMEAAALRADRRGGYAASAAAHERAARLTADRYCAANGSRPPRWAPATPRNWTGPPVLAQEAAAFSEDPRTLAKLAWVRARVEFERGTPRHARKWCSTVRRRSTTVTRKRLLEC